jgi:hypothetical protein
MNYIAGSLLYHADDIIAFELLCRLLNDYHLKEVHMHNLTGFYIHTKTLDKLLDREEPKIAAHFKKHNVQLVSITPAWVICLFSQNMPITCIQRFFSMFWADDWVAFYKLVLLIFKDMEDSILEKNSI